MEYIIEAMQISNDLERSQSAESGYESHHSPVLVQPAISTNPEQDYPTKTAEITETVIPDNEPHYTVQWMSWYPPVFVGNPYSAQDLKDHFSLAANNGSEILEPPETQFHQKAQKQNKKRKTIHKETEGDKCAVCGDVSTGVHYGILACEGCKGFFRRAMSRSPSEPGYSCYYSYNCGIDAVSRTKCRACRLRRCQEAGMLYDAAGQTSSREVKRPPKVDLAPEPLSDSAPFELQIVIQPLVAGVKEVILNAHASTFQPVPEASMSRFAELTAVSDLWPDGSCMGPSGFAQIETFCQNLHFLQVLSEDARNTLLSNNALSVMILRLAYRFSPERSSFVLSGGCELLLGELSSSQLGPGVTQGLASLGISLVRFAIGMKEIAFMSALLLCNHDDLSLDEAQVRLLEGIRRKILQEFEDFMEQRWTTRQTMCSKLLLTLADVCALRYGATYSSWMDPGNLTLP